MPIYAVHSPALRGDAVTAFERVQAVPVGFAPWGFVLGPLWLLAKGLWLALGAWTLVALLISTATARGALTPDAGSALYWLAALWIGLEGRMWQGRALARSGRPLADIIGAATSEDAERIYLQRALATPPSPPLAPPLAPPVAPPTQSPPHARDPHVIGLFPEPGP